MNNRSVPDPLRQAAKAATAAGPANVAPSEFSEGESPMNDPLAGSRMRLLRGGGYLTPPEKSSLTKTRNTRAVEADGPDGPVASPRSRPRGKRAHSPLENLRFPTGPWTRFEEAPTWVTRPQLPQPRTSFDRSFQQKDLDVRRVGPDTIRLCPRWPGLKCSSVAAFGCSVTSLA